MKHLKYFNQLLEELQNRSIPNVLKELSNVLLNDIKDINIPYKNNYTLDVLKFDIDIIYNNDNSYYSNINVYNIITNPLNVIDITIKIPKNYDIHYVLATIIHEIIHVYDIITVNSENDMHSFIKDIKLRNYKIGYYTNFINLIYLSLEHELVARNNMIYPYIKYKDIDIKESKNIIKSSFIWKALEYLKDFNHSEFISNFNLNDLINITNDFNQNILNQNNIMSDYNDIKVFYENFEFFFKETSDTWERELNDEILKIYENKLILLENNEKKSNNVKDLLLNLYINKINKND